MTNVNCSIQKGRVCIGGGNLPPKENKPYRKRIRNAMLRFIILLANNGTKSLGYFIMDYGLVHKSILFLPCICSESFYFIQLVRNEELCWLFVIVSTDVEYWLNVLECPSPIF